MDASDDRLITDNHPFDVVDAVHTPDGAQNVEPENPALSESRDEVPMITGNHENLFGPHSPSFLKEQGNLAYKNGNILEARDLYTDAIMRLEYSHNDDLRAQLYANRAACHLTLNHYDAAVEDTTDAIMLDGSYVKAYLRRSLAYEKKGMQQKALADLEKAVKIDGSLEPQYREKIVKLRLLAEKEFAAEKDQMLGKLKDLGNTLLGKVGLSLDNFKVNKDAATGSYNIQFQN
ncbi:Tetratricopeptide repeat protein 1 [Babesia sp. Xinjiang]|uniref:Tetratricopeptide repeat protein 1 n=1 Tax=Babesia sp. Xinjiang TaxID=462227 RepID=UPI000A241EC0|nr:Tetratricopeptide repeat protein 1 [Babesia sp. Xinjiang]ORM41315.1 Tetratricopeptide repeat protein 1 [Babesia sp. Xinjiang]